MANVSSSNGLEKYPKLRFPGFTEPYKQCRIGEVYAERSQRGAAEMELLSVTINGGVKPRSEIEGKDNSSDDKSNYKIVRAGDMVYNSMRMWQGANGISPCDGIVSPAYTVLMPKSPICNGYFAALFKNPNLINEFRKNSQGMTSDTWNLKYPQIETIRIHIPALDEQAHISAMLGTLDARISKQAQLVEALKKYKRGLLRATFTREVLLSNSAIWERRKFREIASLRRTKYTPSHADSRACVELEHIEQQTGRLISYVDSAEQNSIKSVFKRGDVLFGKLRPYLRKYCLPQFDGVCSSEIWVLIPETCVVSEYLFYLVQSDEFLAAANVSSGTKMPRAEWSKVSNEDYFIPPISEQKRIARMLSIVDHRITTASEMLSALERMRKSFLQQLFI